MYTKNCKTKTKPNVNTPANTPSEAEGPSVAFMIARIPEMLPGVHRRHIEFVYFYLLRAQK